MEYWHNLMTEKSWKILQGLKGKFSFVLIGGWATYLWTRSLKSKVINWRCIGYAFQLENFFGLEERLALLTRRRE